MTIDSNILIAYLAGDEAVVSALSAWKKNGLPLFLPAVVEAELLSFNDWTEKERAEVETFLEEHFITIPFDRTVARLAASIRRGRRIKLPDAAIAATAIYTGSPLATRNIRDFRAVVGLTIAEI